MPVRFISYIGVDIYCVNLCVKARKTQAGERAGVYFFIYLIAKIFFLFFSWGISSPVSRGLDFL